MHTLAQTVRTPARLRRPAPGALLRLNSMTRYIPARGKLSRFTMLLLCAVILLSCALAWSLSAQYAAGLAAAHYTAPVGKRGFLPIKSTQLTVAIVPLQPSAQVLAAIGAESTARAKTAQALLAQPRLEALCANLEELYPFSYEIAAPIELPDSYFDPVRQQYRLDLILGWLVKRCDQTRFRTIGVLAVDVYAPDYNFLFGQAKLFGPACVASTARMGGRVALGRQSPAERWHGLVRHEFGHALGLAHVAGRSVMRYSDTLDGLDAESTSLTRADWDTLRALHPIKWEQQSADK